MIHEYLMALLGGALIGLASVLLMATQGAVMGISGIVSRAISRPTELTSWRLVFIVGILTAPILYALFANDFIKLDITANTGLLIAAGGLVGVGTVIGNGCTSGHGVCGLSRLSTRSLAATVIFMLTAIVTVAIVNTVSGG